MDEIKKIDCGDCSYCCKNTLIPLTKENKDDYLCHELKGVNANIFVLDTKDNGDCVYLENDKCSQYEHRPEVCQYYNCVEFYKSTLDPSHPLHQTVKDDQFFLNIVKKAIIRNNK